MRVEWMLMIVTLRLHEMDFTGILTRNNRRRNARAAYFRAARVQNQNRNIFFDRGHNGSRVENLCSEICHFRSFCERNTFHPVTTRNDAGVRREHAVHVGPDLNLLGIHPRADDGG